MSEGLNAQALLNYLRQELQVRYFTGVPDSVLGGFCASLGELDQSDHVIAANEGNAVGLAIGEYLATGAVPLVYLQNSGIGNAINPLLSLAAPDVYGVPMLLLIGWRGEPGRPDEPQHGPQGEVLKDLLEACCVDQHVLDVRGDRWQQQLQEAHATAIERRGPVAIIVSMGTLRKVRSQRPGPSELPTRESAIACAVDASPPDTVVVATTGMAGRELFELRARRDQDHGLDFYTIGGMGHASQIALAIAKRKPQRSVLCLDGDGAMLMHLGGLSTLASLAPSNLVHVVLNNAVHDSVGGQPTVAERIDLPRLAAALGYASAHHARSLPALTRAVSVGFGEGAAPCLVDARVSPGCRADLGRPTHSPQEQTRRLMWCLGVG